MGFEIIELEAVDITPNLCKVISEWRNSNLRYFFDQKPVTEESSRKFLEAKLQDLTSIFVFAFNDGDPIGHIGIVNATPGVEPELDNLIVGGRAKGHYVAKELARWAIDYTRDKLGAESIGLKLLSHNFLAKRLHVENGFAKIEEIPLHEFSEEGHTTFSTCVNIKCEAPHGVKRAEYWQLLLQ